MLGANVRRHASNSLCMNGLEVDLDSSIIVTNGKAILVSSELAGGIHGNNSLGGNSLPVCVVFGRVAGTHAAKANNK